MVEAAPARSPEREVDRREITGDRRSVFISCPEICFNVCAALSYACGGKIFWTEMSR